MPQSDFDTGAQTLLLARLMLSIGTAGDALDSALAERTIGLYKTECAPRRVTVPQRPGPPAG